MASKNKTYTAPTACSLTNANATLINNIYTPRTGDTTSAIYKVEMDDFIVSSIDVNSVGITYSNTCTFDSGNTSPVPSPLTLVDGTDFTVQNIGGKIVFQNYDYITQTELLGEWVNTTPTTCKLYVDFDVNLVSGGTNHVRIVLKRGSLGSALQSELIIT